ncbi:MAG: CPBP family intramembrane metalloprotease [Acidimicrobiia bacterium]|nr:CPBP family intramembrane metalloprotease [Acidimicrobiia bacterium]
MAQGTSTIGGHRARRVANWHLLSALLALILAPLGAVHFSLAAVAAALSLAVAALAARTRSWPTLRLAAFAAILALGTLAKAPLTIWIGVALLAVAGVRWRGLIPETGWLPPGRVTRAAWWLSAATVVVAAVALTVWAHSTNSFGGSTDELAETLRDSPRTLLWVGGAGFVLINAVAEEIAYRRIAYEAAFSILPPSAAILLQGIAFGAAHVAGFPAGLLGVGLATVYGVTLGALRFMTGGMRLPILVHIAADATIVTLFITVLL